MENVVEIQKNSDKLNWSTIIGVAVFHILALAALFTFSWANLTAAVVFWFISGCLGIGIGYHRLLTHRGFKTPRWFERFLSICGSFAIQSGPLTWVTTHRLHHAFTETDKDPHSPLHGTYWSHMGWIFRGTAQNHSFAVKKRYSPDLVKDPFQVWFDNNYWITSVIAGVVLFAIGGFSMILWAIFLRTVIGWHSTWLVNSATHLWGKRRFDTRDTSRNNGLIAAITWGEGWHNNHHAHPRSARHGLAWYEFDINWVVIRVLEKVGLLTSVYAYDLRSKKPAEPDVTELQPAQDAA
jgi:stearoyl-CoA desaturase (delta-9 desaturase)